MVIHGIGEQRPLETLREFVEVVYRRDRSIASMAAVSDGLLNMSAVPDDLTGSAELRRIATHSDGPQKRADFFEFYWADIMDGTPLDMVTGWIRTLLLRSPFALPRAIKVLWAWVVLWLVALIVLGAGAITAYPDSLRFVQSSGAMQSLGAALAAARPVVSAMIIGLAVLLLVIRVVTVRGPSDPGVDRSGARHCDGCTGRFTALLGWGINGSCRLEHACGGYAICRGCRTLCPRDTTHSRTPPAGPRTGLGAA
ncbi:MAG: hypothetical protein MO852_14935 [Candidatus Devosia euplotis]|nr:hypothetical protein [Candidatus Devosia euplotis]